MTRQNENYNRYLLSDWRPENPAFWENKGKGIARRNLWISVSCLLLAFCVWMLFSAVAVNLNKIGFNFTTDQLFLLTALPSLSGAILRVPYSFMVPLFGGRKWTVLSTVILIIPCAWLGFAVQNPATPFGVFMLIALFGGVRVTLINFIFMALFTALLFLTLPGSGAGSFSAFYLVFMGLFLTAGLGSGSTFQMIAVIFRQITLYNVKLRGGSDEQAQREAVTDTAAALGFISAIGAVGGFFIPKAFGTSLALTGSPVGAMKIFLLFYIACVLLTWLVYGRRKPKQQ
ncbi:hypothetical protein NRW01_000474 [Salmonella enterica]|nr:hypothetical protein [Salmonella enterica]